MSNTALLERIESLPPQNRRIVEELIDVLATNAEKPLPKKLTFSWAGALSHLRDQYTSVELQKKASEWRLDP